MSETPTGYAEFEFSHDGKSRRVFRRGEGPGVLIMHELPGMTRQCLEFGNRVAGRGFTVYLPLMFGQPGEQASLRNLLTLCVSREFRLLARNAHSPITDWMRALCRRIHEERGGRGIGAVGMCLTGGFAISMMLEESVLAPVASQASLPLFSLTRERKRSLGISDEELNGASGRSRAEQVPLLGLRFSRDSFCPRERFEALEESFGEQFEPFVIPSGKDDPTGRTSSLSHSVLTHHFVDREGHPTKIAFEKVITLFQQQLQS